MALSLNKPIKRSTSLRPTASLLLVVLSRRKAILETLGLTSGAYAVACGCAPYSTSAVVRYDDDEDVEGGAVVVPAGALHPHSLLAEIACI